MFINSGKWEVGGLLKLTSDLKKLEGCGTGLLKTPLPAATCLWSYPARELAYYHREGLYFASLMLPSAWILRP